MNKSKMKIINMAEYTTLQKELLEKMDNCNSTEDIEAIKDLRKNPNRNFQVTETIIRYLTDEEMDNLESLNIDSVVYINQMKR